jgi:hypothetical protein
MHPIQLADRIHPESYRNVGLRKLSYARVGEPGWINATIGVSGVIRDCEIVLIENYGEKFQMKSGAYFALWRRTIASLIMSKNNVEKLLFAGGSDKAVRLKYNQIETKEKFVAAAAADGYEFSLTELDEVLKDEDMSFESEGNPRCRSIWLR